MAFLEWSPDFSVGVAAVDYEHRNMIEMINCLYEQMDKRNDASTIANFLGEIHAGIAAHFAFEENLMKNAAYREYEDHKEDHEELLDRIRELMDCYADDPVAGGNRLRQELADWFGQHFSTFDARLHQAL
jgi:hemerythrin-like metal-binding protein